MAPPKPKVRTEPSAYVVTIFPEGHECLDAERFSIAVRRRSRNKWSVYRGQGHLSGPQECMTARGQWAVDEGRRDQLFSLDGALRLAQIWAPQVEFGGWVAAEFVPYHLAQGCRG